MKGLESLEGTKEKLPVHQVRWQDRELHLIWPLSVANCIRRQKWEKKN